MSDKATVEKYSVSLEICRIKTEQEAQALAAIIRDRLADVDEDIWLCVSTYTPVKQKAGKLELVEEGC